MTDCEINSFTKNENKKSKNVKKCKNYKNVNIPISDNFISYNRNRLIIKFNSLTSN